jgi:hypothetical protein
MTTWRRSLGAMALGLVVLALAGCASAPPPVTDDERASIRSEILSALWAPIAQSYPEAIRPVIPVTHTVLDHDWPERMASCLRGRGYSSEVTDNGQGYTDGGQGQTQLVFTVDAYNCQATWVSFSQVANYLAPRQFEAYYNFQVATLQPCLRLAGVITSRSPGRQYALGIPELAGWNPYQIFWQSQPSRSELSYLETRCPPIPGWLDLAT